MQNAWITLGKKNYEVCSADFKKDLKSAIADQKTDVYLDLIDKAKTAIWKKEGDMYSNILNPKANPLTEEDVRVFDAHLEDRPDPIAVVQFLCDDIGVKGTSDVERKWGDEMRNLKKFGTMETWTVPSNADVSLLRKRCARPQRFTYDVDGSTRHTSERTVPRIARFMHDGRDWNYVCMPLRQYSHDRWIRDGALCAYMDLLYPAVSIPTSAFRKKGNGVLLDPVTLSPFVLERRAEDEFVRVYAEDNTHSERMSTPHIAKLMVSRGVIADENQLYERLTECVPLFAKPL